MSNLAQGNRHERHAREELHSRGFRAEIVRRTGKFGGGDPFGVADLLAVGPEGVVHLVQVGTWGHRAGKIRKIVDAGLGIDVWLFLFMMRKGKWVFSEEHVASGPLRPPETPKSEALGKAIARWKTRK